MNKQRLAEFFHSRFFLRVLIGLVAILLVICVFEAGVTVGFHEAEFSYHWGQNYGRNFGEPEDQLGLPTSHMPTPDGTVGQIASITPGVGSTTMLVISSNQKPEEKVLIDSSTVIRERAATLTPDQLSVDMSVVVIGSPNTQGEIEAKLIRVFTTPAS